MVKMGEGQDGGKVGGWEWANRAPVMARVINVVSEGGNLAVLGWSMLWDGGVETFASIRKF
jgi:hypothetical protein